MAKQFTRGEHLGSSLPHTVFADTTVVAAFAEESDAIEYIQRRVYKKKRTKTSVAYIQLMCKNLAGELVEHLGVNGIIKVDGRWSVELILDWADKLTYPPEVAAYELRERSETGCGYTVLHTPILINRGK